MSDPTSVSPPAAEPSFGLMANPRSTVERLLVSEDESRVRAIMRSLSPEQAAHLLQYAPTAGDKARLLGAMERHQRAETLDHVAPAVFATLVENQETQTGYLLGEVSIDRFRELLRMCSPEQRFYWISRAAMHDDAAAQLLILLLPPKDLAEMLLTVADFRKRFVDLRQYAPGQFEEVPSRNAELRAVLQYLADFDSDLYKEVFMAARDILDWEHVNREVTDEFVAPAPIKDFEKFEAPDPDLAEDEAPDGAVRPEAGEEAGDLEEAGASEAFDAETFENALTRAGGGAVAATGLDPERLLEIQSDLDAMIQREIIDAGGSFAPEALEQASGRVHCYLHYGLIRLGGGARNRMIRLLAERSLSSILHAGMEYIEAIRQRALRVAYLRDWFDREQQQLMAGLLRPKVGTTPGKHTEYIFWLPGNAQKKDERPAILIDEARDLLDETAGWALLAQRMPEPLVRRVLASSPAGAQAYLGALAVAVALYRRWDPGLIDLQDVYDFRDRMVDEAASDLTPAAQDVLDAAAERWAAAQGMSEEESRRAGRALVGAAERLAQWLVRYPRPKARQCRNWVYLGDGARE